MKPIIGISVDCVHSPEDPRTAGKLTLNWNYAQAVTEAGGVPVLIPPVADMEEVSRIIDGWLIPGGDDIDAAEFGQENHPKSELQDPERFRGEKSLYGSLSPEVPVLGICYGCQFINVVRGGSLFQHLPDLPETAVHTGGAMQAYQVAPGSKLASLVFGSTTEGKSYHHQAVDRVAEGLSVSARSEDGVIEALEAVDRPWMVGVQWHPERTLEDKRSRALFENFIEAAIKYAERKAK